MRLYLRRKTRRTLHALLVCGLAIAVLHTTGIGCPIKFMTGISCPGCGMTRAWLSALSLRPDHALAYHPLFWSVPELTGIVAYRRRIPRKLFRTLISTAIVAFVAVWVVRLALHHDAGLLFSDLLTTDVVSIGTPKWLSLIRALVVGD